ncbi:MAG: hypothetical protein ACREQR_18460 [Candidatus Binataceae bacterium]
MSRFVRAVTASAAAAVLITGVIAGSARFARAQDAAASQDSAWTATTPGAAVSEPDKAAPPIDVAGCWSGTIEDANAGAGTGALFFVQRKKKLVKGSGASLDIGNTTGIGALKGKATSTSFVATLHARQCKTLAFAGSPSGAGLVGTYILRRCLGLTTNGTFSFTFDATGNSCGGR